jgi:putative ABC transport system permease protein
MALLYIITTLALISAVFLISATMNALIAEQAGEIAILKTLGGRRRQIGGIIVRTAAMLGAAGAIVGTLLGIAVGYLVAHSFAETLIDLPIGFGVAPGVVLASLLAGPALAVAASLPALRRALRRPVAETLTGTDGGGGFGAGWLDRLVARSGLLAEAGVRRVFTAEAMLLVVAGWVAAVPFGWLMYQVLRALVLHSSAISLPDEFPAAIPLGTLAGLLVLTLLVIRLPLRRASRIQPSLALRYQ